MMNILEQVKHYKDGAKTISEWLGDGGQVVDQDTAQGRADVCLKCPLNKDTNPFVGAAALAIRRTLELKSELQLRIKGEKRLGTCDACDCVMKLKVWMPSGRVQQVTDAGEFARLHESCWIRKEAV